MRLKEGANGVKSAGLTESTRSPPRRVSNTKVFSVHAPACVCAVGVARADDSSAPRPPPPCRLTYEPGETRAGETSDGSISATPSVSSSSSSTVSGSSEEPQPLTRPILTDPIRSLPGLDSTCLLWRQAAVTLVLLLFKTEPTDAAMTAGLIPTGDH